MSRVGIRICDLLDREVLTEKIRRNVEEKNFYLTKLFGEQPIDEKPILDEYMGYADVLRPHVADISLLLDEAIRQKKKILFEGAQGCHLDVDYGTYPFVTSSNTVAGNACCGAGVGPTKIDSVVGIVKAYTTRVGEGPFVTELTDEIGQRIQTVGQEFGATTGRKRRCGWLDMVLVRQSVRVSGITGLAITKLDVLTGIDKLKICVGYRTDKGEEFTKSVPADLKVFETLPARLHGTRRLDGRHQQRQATRRSAPEHAALRGHHRESLRGQGGPRVRRRRPQRDDRHGKSLPALRRSNWLIK